MSTGLDPARVPQSMLSKARVAVIGAGSWAVENHIPILKARGDAEVVAICALGSENLEKVRSRFNIPNATEDYEELLDRFAPDGVVISSPHVCHYEHARAAIARRCHVLVEKPFTTDSAQARDLVRLSDAGGVGVVVPVWLQLHPSGAAGCKMWSATDCSARSAMSACTWRARQRTCSWEKPLPELADELLQPSPTTWADPIEAGALGGGNSRMRSG